MATFIGTIVFEIFITSRQDKKNAQWSHDIQLQNGHGARFMQLGNVEFFREERKVRKMSLRKVMTFVLMLFGSAACPQR